MSRGGLFNPNQSSTWQDVGIYGINQNGVGLEANLGYVQRAQFGLEHLGLGLSGPAFENQTVAGIATPEPFYLYVISCLASGLCGSALTSSSYSGIFGLNSQPVNFSSLGNHTSPSFLTALKEANKIPSLSWSYTAGAKYRKY